jgi:hypothetical protein
MAKVANTGGLAKTLTGEVEIFIVGSLSGERVVYLGTHLFSPAYGRSQLILLWRNVEAGMPTFLRAFFSWLAMPVPRMLGE